MATILSANAIVREKELGTLEQLYMTPVRRVEMAIGKMLPYLVLRTLEFWLVAFLMRRIFQVPIAGHFVTLLALLLPFTLTILGFGLLISTKADTRRRWRWARCCRRSFCRAMSSRAIRCPLGFSYSLTSSPATWLIDAARGIILRGADWSVLWMRALSIMDDGDCHDDVKRVQTPVVLEPAEWRDNLAGSPDAAGQAFLNLR